MRVHKGLLSDKYVLNIHEELHEIPCILLVVAIDATQNYRLEL